MAHMNEWCDTYPLFSRSTARVPTSDQSCPTIYKHVERQYFPIHKSILNIIATWEWYIGMRVHECMRVCAVCRIIHVCAMMPHRMYEGVYCGSNHSCVCYDATPNVWGCVLWVESFIHELWSHTHNATRTYMTCLIHMSDRYINIIATWEWAEQLGCYLYLFSFVSMRHE